MPRTLLRVGKGEHPVLGLGIIRPTARRLQIHWAQLPSLDRIAHLKEFFSLLLVVDEEPVFNQDRSGADQHLLK
jgi:hypothetical protein